MRDDLRSQGLVLLSEPFTALGFTHAGEGGGETIDAAVLQTTGINAGGLGAGGTTHRHQCQQPRGHKVLPAAARRAGGGQGWRFRAAHHRPAGRLPHRAAPPQPLGRDDGTAHRTGQLGAHHRSHTPSCHCTAPMPCAASAVRVQWTGDASQDGELKYTGGGNDRDAIPQRIGGTVPTNTVAGYHAADTNMDGTQYTGALNDRDRSW
ncbi:MAG: hypothetical protein R2818_04430 [Flavobacteriales bacterium]